MHLRLPGPRHWTSGDLRPGIRAITGFATAGLVMLGVGGTVYQFIAPRGLLAQLFARSAAGGMAALLALLLIGVSAWMLRSAIAPRERTRMSEILTYALALAGLAYAGHFLMKGAA